jgi:hypothetical protein
VDRLTAPDCRADVRVELLMEFPDPYHSLPIHEWRKYMRAHPHSYATIGVRAWLRSRRRWRLVCGEELDSYGLDEEERVPGPSEG